MPARGWKDVGWRVVAEISDKNLLLAAGGVAYSVLLGLFPGLVALVAIYGLVFDPNQIEQQVNALSGALPAEARQLVAGQLHSTASSSSGTLGLAAIVGLVLALWSARGGASGLISAINIAYEENEKRSFFRFNLIALTLTVCTIVAGLLAITLIAGLPAAMQPLGVGGFLKWLILVLEWPLLVVLFMGGLAVLYRFAAARNEPQWRWVTPGAMAATVLWIAGSILFSIYVGKFGSYNKTYGSLAGAVVLMTWLYLSAFLVLLGAAINAQLEEQTVKDTTRAPPPPWAAAAPRRPTSWGKAAISRSRRGGETVPLGPLRPHASFAQTPLPCQTPHVQETRGTKMPRLRAALLAAAVILPTAAAKADLLLSSNDGHTIMDANKNQVAPNPPGPDTVTVIDVKSYPPKVKATFEAPGSVVGPPGAIWISSDETWGIVTSATKADATAKDGIAPDDRVSVFDLTANPPKITQSLTSGAGATQVRVSPNGTLALIANRAEGTVSIFTVKDKRLTSAGKVDTGNPKSLPSGVVFVDDKNALLTRTGDNMVNVLHIDGTNVTIDPRPITTAVGPYTLDINKAHTLAAVSNMGRGDGDADSVSLIDLTSKPYRTVSTTSVPSGPEPMHFSPDGKYVAIGGQNGTTKPESHPFHHDKGVLGIYAVTGQTLRKVAEVPVGGWTEAVAFSRDGKTILVQSMSDRTIEVFRWDGKTLTKGKTIAIQGAGPESFATAW